MFIRISDGNDQDGHTVSTSDCWTRTETLVSLDARAGRKTVASVDGRNVSVEHLWNYTEGGKTIEL